MAEIIDDNSEVASELKARKEKFSRRMQAFEASFYEKTDEIIKAISEKVEEGISFYLMDAGDDFGVIEAYDADYNFIGYCLRSARKLRPGVTRKTVSPSTSRAAAARPARATA